MFIVSNARSSPANMPLWDCANCLTITFLQRVLPVVVDCLQLIASHSKEKMASTLTAYGVIENMSHATIERSAYCECIHTCWRHQLVMSGIRNVLLICIWLEWLSLRFGLICLPFIGPAGGEIEWSLVVVNKRTGRSLRLGIVSANLLGVKNSLSSLDKSYGMKEDWLDPEAFAEGKRLLLGMLLGFIIGTCRCLLQYFISTYFRNASWNRVV